MMDNLEEGMVYLERQAHIPLDDRGLGEKKALEHIIGACTEALAHPTKVMGVVFAVVMEEDAKLTAPNGEQSSSFLALAGSAHWQYVLVLNMLGGLQRLMGADEDEDEEPEGV